MRLYQQDVFEATAAREPGAIAVDDHGDRLTYGALETRANQIAHLLRGMGCGPNERVCILAEKTANMYAAVLATLKAGACWVPLSRAFPPARLRYLLDVLSPAAIITDRTSAAIVAELRNTSDRSFDVIVLGGRDASEETSESAIASQPTTPPARDVTPDDLAYIIFTSGSTGTPKGVMVRHRSTAQFLGACDQFFDIEPGSRFAHFSDLTFDPSIFDLFYCWRTGGTLVPFNRRSYRINPGAFLSEQNINVLFTVPSVLTALRDTGMLADPRLDSVRHLLLTGEPVTAQLVAEWYAAHPPSVVYNLYGTTETAIVSHWCRLPRTIAAGDPVPVGHTLPGVRVRLLDGNAEAAAGAPGESVVSSSQLAAGYWGNRFQTDLAFQPDPDDPQLPVRVYRTGDSLRRGADGLYYFCGRVDSQVKIRGHRVEIGEIENAVLACDSALEAAVIFDAGAAPADQLIAIVRLDAHGTTDAVREHLRATLPAYMVPAHVIAIDQMPAGPTGKIDREAIRRIATGALAGRTVHDA